MTTAAAASTGTTHDDLHARATDMAPEHPAPAPTPFGRAFDAVAMGTFPWFARVAGYRFEVGLGEHLRVAGHRVLAESWGSRGVRPPADAASYGERFDHATSTWIVCFRGDAPVGVMALLDPSRASIALEFGDRLFPASLDPATTREVARLAIVPAHRGGAQTVMVGLLREMLRWSKANGIERLLTSSPARLFDVYRRYNPTARLVDAPPDPAPEPARGRYFERLRAFGGPSPIYTFDVAGASPWSVFSRFLSRRLRPGTRS